MKIFAKGWRYILCKLISHRLKIYEEVSLFRRSALILSCTYRCIISFVMINITGYLSLSVFPSLWLSLKIPIFSSVRTFFCNKYHLIFLIVKKTHCWLFFVVCILSSILSVKDEGLFFSQNAL